jgi:hypothetical protein
VNNFPQGLDSLCPTPFGKIVGMKTEINAQKSDANSMSSSAEVRILCALLLFVPVLLGLLLAIQLK